MIGGISHLTNWSKMVGHYQKSDKFFKEMIGRISREIDYIKMIDRIMSR